MASTFQRAAKILSVIENNIAKTIFRLFPENFAPALVNHPHHASHTFKDKSLLDLLNESILWAVPKKRRTVEKRRTRRFGCLEYVYKMHLPKTNILICNECGSYKEAGLLCPNCYSKVKEATEVAQKAIQEKLGISPVENEVVLHYLDDPQDRKSNPEFYKGKRVIEIPEKRPKIFSDNLLQRSTQGPATTVEVLKKEPF